MAQTQKTATKSIRGPKGPSAQDTNLLLRAAFKALEEAKKELPQLAPGTYEFRKKRITIDLEAVKLKQGEPYEKSAAGPLPWNRLIAYLLLEFAPQKRMEVLNKVGAMLSKSLETGTDVAEVLESEKQLKATIFLWQQMCTEKAGKVIQQGNCNITVMGANFIVADVE